MTENVQLALVGVFGTFLTGVITALTVYLNLLLSRQKVMQNKIDVAADGANKAKILAGEAVKTGESATQKLGDALEVNTALTKEVRQIVNGERDALKAEIQSLREQLSKKKG